MIHVLNINNFNNVFGLLGGEIVSTFGRPELVRIGTCKLINEVMIGEDKVCVYGTDFDLFLVFQIYVHV